MPLKFNINILFCVLALIFISGCTSNKTEVVHYESENLKIEKIAKNTFVHISYLDTKMYGKVACNGIIVVDKGEAIVFDTPTNDASSAELIDWLENKSGYKVEAVVVTHFHQDCLGGLNTFHQRSIPSYALNRTRILAEANGATIPQNGFETKLELKVGHKSILSEFLGEGHTRDNSVGYFPSEKVMFGGCLVKSEGAGKGNLNDANVSEWSNTMRRVKTKYSDVAIVIPGHGKPGGLNLFDYTINLFNQNSNL